MKEFKRIDNGYGCKADYVGYGHTIEGNNGYSWEPKYYIGDIGFQTLKEAKEWARKNPA